MNYCTSNVSTPLGINQQYTAIGSYTDGTTADITDSVVWDTSAASIVRISNAVGSNGLATPIAIGVANITATQGTISDAVYLTIASPLLHTIIVTPMASDTPLGVKQQMMATGTYSDGISRDITNSVTWTSSASAVATLSNVAGTKGILTPVTPDSITVTATYASSVPVVGTTTASVTAAALNSINITPIGSSTQLGVKNNIMQWVCTLMELHMISLIQ